ncbi:hypothetical protein EDB80DRAFT_692697 [Ilyonectria destructans]|nr:hypothetical protein EDB80DRAFT_692697 [Ilyonectria destructans]
MDEVAMVVNLGVSWCFRKQLGRAVVTANSLKYFPEHCWRMLLMILSPPALVPAVRTPSCCASGFGTATKITPNASGRKERGTLGRRGLFLTFQDAVRVTRLLGKQYLWIDALCIIQGPDGDWNSEARTMEDVFAGAYCTIAASSARGWGDGFLKPNLDSSGIGMPGIPSTPTCACDFDKDVGEGPLLKRAWVLQERVLSRRITHFCCDTHVLGVWGGSTMRTVHQTGTLQATREAVLHPRP